MNKERRDTRAREREYIREQMGDSTPWILFVVSVCVLIIMTILFSLAVTGLISVKAKVPYEEEVRVGVSREMDIDTNDIYDVQLVMENTYVVTVKGNAYLVSINVDHGIVTFVDVEEALLEE